MTADEHPAGRPPATVAERCLVNALQAARRGADELAELEADADTLGYALEAVEDLEAALELHRGRR
ncbi:MAG: hypothetical protein ACF8PN_05030 [Phycisphaerales bacterium]